MSKPVTKKQKIARYKELCGTPFCKITDQKWNEYLELSEDLSTELRSKLSERNMKILNQEQLKYAIKKVVKGEWE